MHYETHCLTGTLCFFRKNGKSKARKIDIAKKGPTPDGIRFMHLTDFHVGKLHVSTEKIIESIKVQDPDFIVMTGDYFINVKEIEVFFNLMKEIRANYEKSIYLCFGNHDNGDVFQRHTEQIKRVADFLKDIDIIILENASASFEKYTQKLNIIGLADARTNKADVNALVEQLTCKDCPNLLMTHNADILLSIKEGAVDFAVTGHTHGAQVRTPFNIEIKLLHRKDKLSQINIIYGLHRFKNIDLYINRGLGNTFLPIRFLSKPEILIGFIPNEP